MPFHRLTTALAATMLLAAPAMAASRDCPFRSASRWKGATMHRTVDGSAWLAVTRHRAVDADGAPNAYHPADAGQPCEAPGLGLDCLANAGYPGQDWWPNVLVPDGAMPDRPLVQADGPYQGYFVSQTSLRHPVYAGVAHPDSYVDARAVPYIVLPASRAGRPGFGDAGDLGYAIDLGTGRSTAFIVGDTGPDYPLGEASIAFWRALTGRDPGPRDGDGLSQGALALIVFPGSGARRVLDWPIRPEQIDADVEELLWPLGGGDAVARCAGLPRAIRVARAGERPAGG